MFHVPKIYHCKENILKYLYWTRKRLPHLGRNRPERSNVYNCNTNIYKIRKLCKTIFSLFYNILQHANCPFIFEFQTILFTLLQNILHNLPGPAERIGGVGGGGGGGGIAWGLSHKYTPYIFFYSFYPPGAGCSKLG